MRIVQDDQHSRNQILSLLHERIYQKIRDISVRSNRSATMFLSVQEQVRGRNEEKTKNNQNEQCQRVSLTETEAIESENDDEVHLLLHLEAERNSRKTE